MEEVLLCNCPNSIIADNVINILNDNGIVLRQHDETMDQRSGAYGPAPGIAIYVFEKDYEKALKLVAHIIDFSSANIKLFCPKCDSEDVVRIRQSKYIPYLIVISILFFFFPCVYWYNSENWSIKSTILDYLSVVLLIISIVSIIICCYKNVNYKCNKCGKKFNHI